MKKNSAEDKLNKKAGASTLAEVLNSFHPISPDVIAYIEKHSFSCVFRRGKLLLRAGDMCEHVYFIKKGAVRGFIKDEGKDITTWITAENEMVTSIASLDRQEPVIENMQAIENTDTLALSYTDLHNLYIIHPEFNIVTRKLLQQYYRDAEGRAFIARLINVENKYRNFLKNHSHLANRIPLKYIASFLGTTPETISRVRKKLSLSDK